APLTHRRRGATSPGPHDQRGGAEDPPRPAAHRRARVTATGENGSGRPSRRAASAVRAHPPRCDVPPARHRFEPCNQTVTGERAPRPGRKGAVMKTHPRLGMKQGEPRPLAVSLVVAAVAAFAGTAGGARADPAPNQLVPQDGALRSDSATADPSERGAYSYA